MADYIIFEVNGQIHSTAIELFNAKFPAEFLPLKPKHFEKGFWWLVGHGSGSPVVGFAGMVPFDPFPRVGYLKRAAVLPEHRGHGLQRQLMEVREAKARDATDWTHLVSECAVDNVRSANNFIRAGFELCEPERPWEPNTLYWRKAIAR